MSLVPPDIEPTRCEFDSGGLRCRGWFYPPDRHPPHPCIVMAHGFGAAPNGPLGDTGRRFAAAGIAAFAFDYRHFGASDGEPRQLLDIPRRLDDWAAAVGYVRGRSDVDPHLVGLWGSSLSGGEVLSVAGRDHEIAAVVAQVPYTDGFSLARAAGLRSHLRMLPSIVRDLLRARTGRPPYLIHGLGPPGDSAAISTQTADLYETVVENAPSWHNTINARSLLQIYSFRPMRAAGEIRCPLLVVLTYRDRIAPSDVALRAAQGLPYVELAMFRARHFDLYSGGTYERAVRTEVRFFKHHLDLFKERVRTDAGTARAASPTSRQ